MPYTATIEGTYRTRVYINLILFKIARGWRTDRFSWSHQLPALDAHLSFVPLQTVPIAVAVYLTPTGAELHLKVLSADFPVATVFLGSGLTKAFHWEPLKGVILDATVSVSEARTAA